MALGLSVLMMALLGLVQFALYEHARNVVTTAAEEGARVASSDGRTVADGVGYAQSLVAAGLGETLQDVQVNGTSSADAVAVDAQGQLQLIIPWVASMALPVDARVVMHKEKFYAGPNS